MIGTAIAMHRNEHLRLTLFVEMLPPRTRDFVNAFALVAVAAFLIGLMHPAYEYAREEWDHHHARVEHPEQLPRRVDRLRPGGDAGRGAGLLAWKTVKPRNLVAASAVVGASAACATGRCRPWPSLGSINIVIFLVGLRRASASWPACRSPSASAWARLSFLAFTTQCRC